MFKGKPPIVNDYFKKVLVWLYVNESISLDVILVKKYFKSDDKR